MTLIEAAVQFLISGPALHRCRVGGEVLTRAEVAERLAANPIPDAGPWQAGKQSADVVTGVFVASEDFEHDVRLYVNGDFSDVDQKMAYALGIARSLNAARMSWRPMATAPQEAPVLLIFDDGDIALAKNGGQATAQHNDWWTLDGLDFGFGASNPVGWLPRDALPAALAE